METSRRAARVLLIDDLDRVLLFHGVDPADPDHPYWFTPGGGLDHGEPSVTGAARELFEETGLAVAPADLGEPVHEEIARFSFGGVAYVQEQQFFLVRVARWDVITTGFDEVERGSIDGYRWWSVPELRGTAELYYPVNLIDLVERVC
jgi:8-oxo-dGTP pyrophosphatase MutT (NUDIX family)